jgi:hypothetical protein
MNTAAKHGIIGAFFAHDGGDPIDPATFGVISVAHRIERLAIEITPIITLRGLQCSGLRWLLRHLIGAALRKITIARGMQPVPLLTTGMLSNVPDARSSVRLSRWSSLNDIRRQGNLPHSAGRGR